MDDSMNKIIANLQFGITGALSDLEKLEKAAIESATKVQKAYAEASITIGAGTGSTKSDAELVKQLNATQLKRLNVLREGEAKAQAIFEQSQMAQSALAAETYANQYVKKTMADAQIRQSQEMTDAHITQSALKTDNDIVLAREKADSAILLSAETTAARIGRINAEAGLVGAKTGAVGAESNAKVSLIQAQEAKVQASILESEAKQNATIVLGEANKTKALEQAALTRVKIVTEENKAELAVTKQKIEQEKLLYMQSRKAAFEDQPQGMAGLLLRHMSWFATGAVLFEGFALLKESLVDVEVGLKGLQTVLPELHESQEAYNMATEETINLMQKLGADLNETMTAARSFGRMYKDVETVMGLTNNAILLNVIDQVALEDAVKGNEVALSTYGDALRNVNDVLAFSGKLMDSITILSHNTLATGTDLVSILQQTSSAAKQAGTDLDQLLGLGAASIRATGLQGQGGNIGRMLRTVFTQLSAPSEDVEKSISAIGVSMRGTNGELRSAYDIILDLSLATKDASLSQEELNDAMLKASSGRLKLAA